MGGSISKQLRIFTFLLRVFVWTFITPAVGWKDQLHSRLEDIARSWLEVF